MKAIILALAEMQGGKPGLSGLPHRFLTPAICALFLCHGQASRRHGRARPGHPAPKDAIFCLDRRLKTGDDIVDAFAA